MARSLPRRPRGLGLACRDRNRDEFLCSGAERHAAQCLGQAALERKRATPPASSSTDAITIQSPVGDAASRTPPTAGPTVNPTCQESAEIAM